MACESQNEMRGIRKHGCRTIEPVGDDRGDEELKKRCMDEWAGKTWVSKRRQVTAITEGNGSSALEVHLAAVGVGTRIRHGKEAGLDVLELRQDVIHRCRCSK